MIGQVSWLFIKVKYWNDQITQPDKEDGSMSWVNVFRVRKVVFPMIFFNDVLGLLVNELPIMSYKTKKKNPPKIV